MKFRGDTLRLEVAEKIFGKKHVWNRTTSQKCKQCGQSIFREDILGEKEPEVIQCPHCLVPHKNIFA